MITRYYQGGRCATPGFFSGCMRSEFCDGFSAHAASQANIYKSLVLQAFFYLTSVLTKSWPYNVALITETV